MLYVRFKTIGLGVAQKEMFKTVFGIRFFSLLLHTGARVETTVQGRGTFRTLGFHGGQGV